MFRLTRTFLVSLWMLSAALGAQEKPAVWLRLDEGTGNVISNAAGSSRGELKGAKWSQGKSGKALEVNGTNAYASAAIPELPGSFTFSAWTKPLSMSNENPGGEACIVARTGYHNALGYNLRGRFYFGIWQADNKNPAALSPVESPVGAWHHVVGVYDKDGAKIHLYVNGELKATAPMTAAPRTYPPQLFIGTGSTGGKYSFGYRGIVDEVKVFDRALGAQEIKAAYDAQK
ncbi:MAG: LamG domain-containing protein [Spirochaetes bacterium]|nr:LamG domain-containing protein [Spirochaetota bacterium]